jgi:excinuclease ABC subunit A
MEKIILKGITHHNLKNIDVEIPHDQFTVISGVSGSGKSTLAEDVIYKDAERRYLETYSIHARQLLNKLRRPEAEHISGLRPAILLQQKNYVNSPRSTVGTLTEIHDLLRLFFARLGQSTNNQLNIKRSLFSFNTPEGACPNCKGLGLSDKIDPDLLISDPEKSLREGVLVITTPTGYIIYSQVTMDVMAQVCESEGFSADTAWKDLTEYQKNVVWYGSQEIKIPFGKHTLESRMKWKGITAKPREEGYYKGIIPVMEEILKRDRNPNILRFVKTVKCEACSGTRFNENALSVKHNGKNIADLLSQSIKELKSYFQNLKFSPKEKETGEQIRKELIKKAEVLEELGVGYLTLDRSADTLSGGEAARIRLSGQINSKLRGVLYVFDEPAAGLHAADMEKLMNKITGLCELGNTVIAVDHNEQIIRKADYIVELGPAAGVNGGELIYQGVQPNWNDLAQKSKESKTATYLSGQQQLEIVKHQGCRENINIFGAKSRNLKNLNISFPLNQLVIVTGVSGAGKSSLLKYTLANYLRKKLNGTNIEHGKFEKIEGIENIDKIIEVDQAPIGKTPRSNPATYTKLFDLIRDFYAKLDEAKKTGLTKSNFSFNTKGGRCENCQGAGYLQTGMHFLGNVDIVCPECNGKRFQGKVLKVKYKEKNVFDILELSINQAHEFFIDSPKIEKPLKVLVDLGLGYLKLGQRSSTLSGGEAQRVKLAAELSKTSTGKTLYILDEPSRGLHLHDINVLLKSFYKLLDNGNSVMLIEHNLRLVQAADYVIDLGPGSGEEGGEIVFEGKPKELIECKESRTGQALKKLLGSQKDSFVLRPMNDEKEEANNNVIARSYNEAISNITMKGVSTNNLKNINLELPVNQLIVFTGVSGSGKSSLLFDTLYAEGQKRFNENFSPYIRTMLGQQKKADFEQISGLSPVIAIKQKRLKSNARSTVGTLTEIYDYYRLLYSRIGQLRYPEKADSLTASHFSFNQSQGFCKHCEGLGFQYIPDAEKVVTDVKKSLIDGALNGTKTGKFYGDLDGQYVAALQTVGKTKGIDFSVAWKELSEKAKKIAFEGCGEELFDVKWHYKRKNREGIHKFQSKWPGFSGHILEEYQRKQADKRGEELLPLMKKQACTHCKGKRLNDKSLSIEISTKNISELTALTIDESILFFKQNGNALNQAEKTIFEPIAIEVIRRLELIHQNGLSYLSLDRLTGTLSGGEAQRLRLAGMLGSELSGITYILDEPTAGLHPSDTEGLIEILKQIRNLGNTVIIAEHDEEIIRAADYLVDLGPGAGENGGEIVAEGNYAQLLQSIDSLTASYLSKKEAQVYRKQKEFNNKAFEIKRASANNLKNIDADFYASCINVITGVSGSGKSSLLFDVVQQSLKQNKPMNCSSFNVLEQFENIVFVDQEEASTSSLSSIATFTGIFDYIRDEFAKEAKKTNAKINKNYFSYNTKGGRCETCKGQGFTKTALDFLPDVFSVCTDCNGKRYTIEALKYTLNGKSIAEVLELSVQEAAGFFTHYPKIKNRLEVLKKTNLAYLKISQRLNTLSGGELQRLKLAVEFMKPSKGKSLYLLDEPTTGLHFEDIKQLILLFDKLTQSGHTLVITEHNPTLISNADYIVDLGVGGGDKGGEIVVSGNVKAIKENNISKTGRYLKLVF